MAAPDDDPRKVAVPVLHLSIPIIKVEHIEPALKRKEESKEDAVALVERMIENVNERKTRSAWEKGVKEYALELLDIYINRQCKQIMPLPFH